MKELQISENTSRNTHPRVAELVLEDTETRKVLDIPCGAGAFSYRLLKQGKEVPSADIENGHQGQRTERRGCDRGVGRLSFLSQ